MPKKTRKDKITSLLRKKSSLLKNVNTSRTDSFHQKKELQPNTDLISNRPHQEVNTRKHFIRDLRKSLLISGVIFTLEIILYFVSMSNYISKIGFFR